MSVTSNALDGSAWQHLVQDDTLTRWNWLHNSTPHYSETENISSLALECWRFEGRAEDQQIFRVSDLGSNIETWLEEVPPTAEGGIQVQGGLRIIYSAQLNASQVPYTETEFAKIKHALKLPHIEAQDWLGSNGFSTVLEEEEGARVYILRGSSVGASSTTILRYEPLKDIIVGYILASPDMRLEDTLRRIPFRFFGLPHQLLVPTLLFETEVAMTAQRLANLETNISLLESGVHDILHAQDTDEHCRKADGTLEELAHLQTNLSTILDETLPRLKLHSAFLLGELTTLEDDLSVANRPQHKCASLHIRSILETLASSLDHLALSRKSLGVVERWEKKIFEGEARLIWRNQERSGAMQLEIAKMSIKEDTTSDWFVLILTLMFVPSTFVATVLTMPFFNWNAKPGERILSQRFYIFWAINIPLSFLLFALLLLWTRSRDMERKRSLI